MAQNRQAKAARPVTGDAAIKAKTGRDWAGWFAALDKAGAGRLDHKGIVGILNGKMGVGPWHGQMIAVSYERARGLREANQKCDGQFSVGVSKVTGVPLAKLFATATADIAAWFPKGGFEETSKTRDKYLRGKWKKDARVSIYFYAKGADKSSITVDCEKLADAEAVEKERAAWKKAVAKLETLL